MSASTPGARTLRPLVAALALLPLTTGCAAVVALPLLAGAGLMARDKVRVRAATPVPDTKLATVVVGPAGDRAAPAATSQYVVTDLTELPPPSRPSTPQESDRWDRFFGYALAPQAGAESALLASGASLTEPRRTTCPKPPPAVVIDLDQGGAAFDPQSVGPAPPAIAQGLARLREAGITVLWISQLPAAQASEVAAALKVSGLDPEGRDQLLLLRSAEDRKQVLRNEANRDVCVVAIAGDRRGDFDELFDYLRNPGAAAGLYPMMGSGWFLVPPLFGPEEDVAAEE